jgi:hypothetical protein
MTTEYYPKRSGKDRRCGDNEECSEHSGMVERDNSMMAWVKGIFAMASIIGGLLSYSVLWQAPKLSYGITDVRNEITNIRRDMKEADCTLDKRVSGLEDVVYHKK